MNKRAFLLAPVAALALLTFAVPASAQIDNPDLLEQYHQLRLDAHDSHLAITRVERMVNRCDMPSADEVLLLAKTANDVVNRAGALAPVIGGREHATTLSVRAAAVDDIWWLTTFQSPDVCYQPPAE